MRLGVLGLGPGLATRADADLMCVCGWTCGLWAGGLWASVEGARELRQQQHPKQQLTKRTEQWTDAPSID